MTTNAVDSLDAAVKPEVEVVPSVCGDEVSSHWATTFAVGVHVLSMCVSPVLLTRKIVRSNTGPVGTGESLADDVDAGLNIKLSIHGWVIGARNSREHSIGSVLHIFGFPSIWEVVIPIRRVWLAKD
jgi:hypothetical protein